MDVAQFSYEYPPQSTGGLGTYLEGLMAFQREQGDKVDLFYLGEPPVPAGAIELPSFNGELLTYTTADLLARNRGRSYDLVVCQDWPGVLQAQGLWRAGIPLVFTLHLPIAWDIGWYEDIPVPFAPQLEFSGLAHADLIIVVSEAVERYLHKEFSFTRGKTCVIHNGTDPAFFTPDPIGGARPQSVLYVGRFYEQKGFDLVPHIFAEVAVEHPDCKFTIIGTGELEREARIEFDRLEIADRVTWLRFSGLDTVRDLYRRASVVVMPSRLEPFGLVAIEAMSTGTPLVAASTGGLAEIVRDGETGLLAAPGDVRGFAQRIAAVLADSTLARRLSKQGRAAVIREFDQRACHERTRRAYHAAVQTAAGATG